MIKDDDDGHEIEDNHNDMEHEPNQNDEVEHIELNDKGEKCRIRHLKQQKMRMSILQPSNLVQHPIMDVLGSLHTGLES